MKTSTSTAIGLVAILFASTSGTLWADPAVTTSEVAVLSAVSPQFLDRVADTVVPAPDGTVGLNRGSWSNIAEQRDVFRLTAAGIAGKNSALLVRAFRVADAGFAHQTSDGGFDYNLARSPAGAGVALSQTQQAAEAAFFISDVAHSLLLMQQSSWFKASKMTTSLHAKVASTIQKVDLSLRYLLAHKSDLATDTGAVNRLLIYAQAYALAGELSGNADALSAAHSFLDQALSRQSADGTFLELGGFDSSYQCVSIAEAEFLFLQLSASDGYRNRLWNAIERGYDRTARALGPDGQLTTNGNTRVTAQSAAEAAGHANVHALDQIHAGYAFSYYAAITGSATAKRRAALLISHYYQV